MKKYLPLLFVLIMACSDDDKVLSNKPPFDDYMFALQFWHTPGTSTYSKVDAFSSWGQMEATTNYQEEYVYSTGLDYDGALPSNVTLKVATKESNVFLLEMTGALARWGTKVPESYTGNPELWGSIGCNFKVVIECNPVTEEIIAGSLELWNAKFKFKEDITSRLRISNYEPYEKLWRISSDDQVFTPNADFSISVRLSQ
ncbi:MAG TPA: hypothetical protein VFT90_04140 [Chryseosolibacter sp.]|nr:hypothetical protein [Chryseosolibacter sp.]